MSNLVKYWVVKSPSKEGDVEIAHFKSDKQADAFLNSSFFTKTHKQGRTELVSFDIFDDAKEAEVECVRILRESGLAKLKTLTKKEAITLGLTDLLDMEDEETFPIEDSVPVSG